MALNHSWRAVSATLLVWGAACLAPAVSICSQTAPVTPGMQSPSFEEKLREVRLDLHVGTDGFSGTAAPVLEKAIADANYVLIGEDHLAHEIPQFASAVCDLMGKQGPLSLAEEVGPLAAKFVSDSLDQPDRIARMAALQQRFPDSVAFVNVVEENDLVEHAASVAKSHGFQFWGLDQEFLGSAGWLLQQIADTHLAPAAAGAIARLQAEEEDDRGVAYSSGDPAKLFLFAASDTELSAAGELLHAGGRPEANALFDELLESRKIYIENRRSPSQSNQLRARLLKSNLRQHLETAFTTGQRGKVLVKFGDWHLYKGVNPLHQRDLGNWIAEWADGRGETSLHICVLGAKGTHLLYGGYQRPPKTERFVMAEDPYYQWLKPAVDNQVPGAWTLYDLRRLRYQNPGSIDPRF